MPDLTMCREDDCVKRQSCRRSPHSGTIANDRFQSWFADDPRKDPVVHRDIYCLHYWPMSEAK